MIETKKDIEKLLAEDLCEQPAFKTVRCFEFQNSEPVIVAEKVVRLPYRLKTFEYFF
jgi:hypothetical protein